MAIKRYNTKRGVRCRNTETNLFVRCSTGLGGRSKRKPSLGQLGQVLQYKGASLEPVQKDGELWWAITIEGHEFLHRASTVKAATKFIDSVLSNR